MNARVERAGTLLALEGIDGSGKGTQAERLRLRLADRGYTIRLFSFPRYTETVFGKSVADFLNGRFGSLRDVHPLLASLLYAGDRFESRGTLLEALGSCDLVICDRYVPSNVAHQASKLVGDERDELVQWIETVEYDIFRLPRPDAVVFLDMPVDKAQELVALKHPRHYTDKRHDLQEADADYLHAVADVYRHLATTRSGWHTIACVHGSRVRPIDEIAAEIDTAVDKLLTAAVTCGADPVATAPTDGTIPPAHP